MGYNKKDLRFLREKEFTMNGYRAIIMIKNGEIISNLARDMNITQSNLTRIVNTLENEGILTRKVDGRRKYLYLTKKGKELRKYMTKIHNIFERK